MTTCKTCGGPATDLRASPESSIPPYCPKCSVPDTTWIHELNRPLTADEQRRNWTRHIVALMRDEGLMSDGDVVRRITNDERAVDMLLAHFHEPKEDAR